MKGCGCPKCVGRNRTEQELINEIIEIHGDKYDYSNINYVNMQTPINIKCKVCGVKFTQNPNNHLHNKSGCPYCKTNKLENKCVSILKTRKIQYERKKHFKWLRYKYPLELDFYLPEYNIAIECQGIQHFEPVEWFGGEKSFFEQRTRDKIKSQLCNDNNLPLYYINYNDDVEEKLNEIIN